MRLLRVLPATIGVALCLSAVAAPPPSPTPKPPQAPRPAAEKPAEKPVPTTLTPVLDKPSGEWNNTSDEPTAVDVPSAPKDAVLVELGRKGRLYRILPTTGGEGRLRVIVPPKTTVQLWSRAALAEQSDPAFATAARWGGFPSIAVGAVTISQRPDARRGTPTLAWETAPGRFRAYPEADLPVAVTVRNQGIAPWSHARIRLFVQDNWTTTPDVVPLVSTAVLAPKKGAPSASATERGLLPGDSATANFTVRLPKLATVGRKAPLVAFLRFDVRGETVTVQNSVELTVEEPIERRYAMNEAGTKFVVRLINRFKPSPLGDATVEVRQPAGTNWTVTPPPPVTVKGDADATATVTPSPPGDDQIGVPVVVTLGGYRMGYTPVIYTVAAYGGAGADGKPNVLEKGLTRIEGEGSSSAPQAAGLCFQESPDVEHKVAYRVAEKFAVSDPTVFVSPTWVTVVIVNRTANRIRLEYDAFGSATPVLAGDMPLDPGKGDTTLTFLLPDARFQGGLPGGADFRLVISGGDACIRRVTASKWNSLKTAAS